MSENKKLKGTWVQRFFIIVLGLILGVLLFWLLGFLTDDIGSLRGPDFQQVRARHVDAALDEKLKSLNETLDGLKKNINNRREQQDILKKSTDSLQNTINQLLSIEKQNIEKNLTLSGQQQQILSQSQTMFMENQNKYQDLNEEVFDLTEQQQQLEKERDSVSAQILTQENSARQEYNQLQSRHRLRVAALKLGVMIPLFLISAWFFIKKRSGTFWPIVYAVFIAAFVRISMIVHEYFPREYFKYIALLVIIGIVLKLLICLIKTIVSPKEDKILKRHQEAYDKNICPSCNKPIRIGPLRYIVNRKKASLVLAGQVEKAPKQEIYTCPKCGTQLYEKCSNCSDIRHSLLPFCEHCGNEKTDWM
jgi:predicted RNA-binding Zn-ribbon protein involved in translation (DUF1610 family)